MLVNSCFIKKAVCAAICLLLTGISTASSATYNNLIVFGDSLSDAASLSSEPNMAKEKDIGNNYWVHAAGKIGAPITSLTLDSHLNPLWPNILVQNTMLFGENPNHTQYIYPARQAHALGFSPLRYNTNYAWASAETGNHYLNDFDLNEKTHPPFIFPSYSDDVCDAFGPGKISENTSCVPGVLLQVKTYLNDVNGHPNPRSLIIIWAGGNDIFNNAAKIADQDKGENKALLFLKLLTIPYPLDQNIGVAPLSNPINNLKQAVMLLIQAGVSPKNIYVINMPNLAQTPAAKTAAQGQKAVLYLWDVISRIFNTGLEIALVYDYVHPQFNLPRHNIISANKMLTEIVAHEQRYGFSRHDQSCVKDHAPPDCPGYIFFDDKHPTAKTHVIIADELAQTLLNAKK